MSSFRRRVTSTPIAGTRPSPYNSLTLLSTGLSALDDILGGGLPLSSSLLLQSDDVSAYGELLLKFWIAQGLECKHETVVVGSSLDVYGPREIVETLMDIDGGSSATTQDEQPSEDQQAKDDKLKIAFRYEGMKQHATTISAPSPPKGDETETYCSLFDLTMTRQLKQQDRSLLTLVDVDEIRNKQSLPSDLYELLYQRLEDLIVERDLLISPDPSKPRKALRIAISTFGSSSWGPSSAISMFRFLHRLRALLRRSTATAFITFPLPLYKDNPSLVSRLSHASDAVVTLTSFASSPVLLSQFPRHQGLISVPKLPSLNSLVPPSAKLSVLRGLGGGGDGRENNLGFRLKRRRFVIETVNVDEPIGPEERKPVKRANAQADDMGKVGGTGPKEAPPRESKVRFGGEQVLREPASSSASAPKSGFRKANTNASAPSEPSKPSVSAMIHKQPELFEF